MHTVCDSLIVNTSVSHTLKNKLARLLYIFQRALTVPFSRLCAQRHGHCSGSSNEIVSNTFIIIFQMSRFFFALKGNQANVTSTLKNLSSTGRQSFRSRTAPDPAGFSFLPEYKENWGPRWKNGVYLVGQKSRLDMDLWTGLKTTVLKSQLTHWLIRYFIYF